MGNETNNDIYLSRFLITKMLKSPTEAQIVSSFVNNFVINRVWYEDGGHWVDCLWWRSWRWECFHFVGNPKMISDKVCTQGSELIDVDRLVPEMIRNFELLSPYILIFFLLYILMLIYWQCWGWERKRVSVTQCRWGKEVSRPTLGTESRQWQSSIVINHEKINHIMTMMISISALEKGEHLYANALALNENVACAIVH